MRPAWISIAVALVLLTAAPAGAGGLTSSTSYQSHPVHGATAAELLRDMNAHPIIDPDGGPSYANITHAHTLSLTTVANGNLCRVSDIAFDWQFVITLPEATAGADLPASARATWQAFVATLEAHEEHHRAIFLECGREFLPAAAALTAPSCGALDSAVRRQIAAQYAACMAKQRAFDVRDHPRIMATPFMREAGGR